MAHVLLEGLDVVTGFDAVHGERMPEVMDPVMLQAGFLQDLLEFLPDGRLNVVIAVLVAEDEVWEITFIPERTGGEFLCSLDSLVVLQHIHDERRREYDPGLSVLQRAPVVLSAAFLTGRGELLLHMDDAVLKVDAVPGEADQFSAAQSGEEIGEDQILEFFTFEGSEKLFLFFLV